jgi:hypothetical protein
MTVSSEFSNCLINFDKKNYFKRFAIWFKIKMIYTTLSIIVVTVAIDNHSRA